MSRWNDHGPRSGNLLVHPRRRKRYSTDLTDAEWALVEPLLPQRRPGEGRGAPRKHDRREILNALCYQARTGCIWADLPGDFPPKSTV